MLFLMSYSLKVVINGVLCWFLFPAFCFGFELTAGVNSQLFCTGSHGLCTFKIYAAAFKKKKDSVAAIPKDENSSSCTLTCGPGKSHENWKNQSKSRPFLPDMKLASGIVHLRAMTASSCLIPLQFQRDLCSGKARRQEVVLVLMQLLPHYLK